MLEGVHGFSSPRADVFPAGLRVLVVDDDPTWLKILEKMLKKCSYEVTTCGLAIEALDLLRERKDGFDIVISDVNMPDMDGFKLLEHVGLEMDLPVIMMSVDGETSRVMRGVQHGACDYLLKPIRMKELRNIWQHVYRKKIHEVKDSESHEGLEEILMMRNVSEQLSDDGFLFCGGDSLTPGKKRKDAEYNNNKYDEKEFSDHSSVKKARVVWTVDLHQKFVKAVNHIGFEKVGPKKILDLMNVPWLTRENVASHLQKYRLYLTRLQKDDLKTSSSGPKHPDFSPAGELPEPIKIQQNPNSIIHELDPKRTPALQTIEPKKILTGYAATCHKATSSNIAINHSFNSTPFSTFNSVMPAQHSVLPAQHSWNVDFTSGPVNLGPPVQPITHDPVTSSTWSVTDDHKLQQQTNNLELSAFILQGQQSLQQHCSSINLEMQNDQEFINEVPSSLYDALRFDYEFPPDSLEYPVIDQGLFIV